MEHLAQLQGTWKQLRHRGSGVCLTRQPWQVLWAHTCGAPCADAGQLKGSAGAARRPRSFLGYCPRWLRCVVHCGCREQCAQLGGQQPQGGLPWGAAPRGPSRAHLFHCVCKLPRTWSARRAAQWRRMGAGARTRACPHVWATETAAHVSSGTPPTTFTAVDDVQSELSSGNAAFHCSWAFSFPPLAALRRRPWPGLHAPASSSAAPWSACA